MGKSVQTGAPVNAVPASAPALTAADIGFLVFLSAILVAVVWLGRIAYLEGMKTEVAKENGEAWAKWFTEASAKRSKLGYAPAACAAEEPQPGPAGTNGKPTGSEVKADTGANASPALPRTWGECLEALMQGSDPLAGLRNPFSGKPPAFVVKCDPADRTMVGAIVLEKLTPTPPGSAVAVTASPLANADVIEQKLQLRVIVCDKGAYPIRIAEVDF